MSKLKLSKNPHKGLKIYCRKCNKDNSNCKHFESQVYRVRIHVPGTQNEVRAKQLESTNYNDAVIEAIAFEKELISNGFIRIGERITENSNAIYRGNDYSLADAVVRYGQFLDGESGFAHLKKNVSAAHKQELLRYCTYFSHNVRKSKDITVFRAKDVSKEEVSSFYLWAEGKYKTKTLKKIMSTLKGFFEFLIDIEEIEMRNPYRNYIIKGPTSSIVETITKSEFEEVLKAVDKDKDQPGGRGIKKHLYGKYLRQAFELFLLTGCRREELVVMKWSDIYETATNIKFIYIDNIKVQRIRNKTNVLRPIPITSQLMDLLIEMGYNEKYMSEDYILCPIRDMSLQSLMDFLSKSFTDYWKSTKNNKECSLKNLRKTYFTWVNRVMGDDTKILSSHSSNEVLKKFYLDPKLSPIIAKGAAEIRIFD